MLLFVSIIEMVLLKSLKPCFLITVLTSIWVIQFLIHDEIFIEKMQFWCVCVNFVLDPFHFDFESGDIPPIFAAAQNNHVKLVDLLLEHKQLLAFIAHNCSYKISQKWQTWPLPFRQLAVWQVASLVDTDKKSMPGLVLACSTSCYNVHDMICTWHYFVRMCNLGIKIDDLGVHSPTMELSVYLTALTNGSLCRNLHLSGE